MSPQIIPFLNIQSLSKFDLQFQDDPLFTFKTKKSFLVNFLYVLSNSETCFF